MEGEKKKEKKEKEVEEDRVLSRLHLKMAADGSSHDATIVHPPITYSNFIEESHEKRGEILSRSVSYLYGYDLWKCVQKWDRTIDFRIGKTGSTVIRRQLERPLIFVSRKVKSRV